MIKIILFIIIVITDITRMDIISYYHPFLFLVIIFILVQKNNCLRVHGERHCHHSINSIYIIILFGIVSVKKKHAFLDTCETYYQMTQEF